MPLSRQDLVEIVHQAVVGLGGNAKLIDIAKWIWRNHEADLRASGDLFYKWQYDMRWAALELRKQGRLANPDGAPKGVWMIAK